MSVNRFTTYTPSEFAQTYERMPFNEMFKLAQYKQKRQDTANAALDELASNSLNLKAGYMTTDLRKQVYNDYNKELDNLTTLQRSGASPTELLSGVNRVKQKMRQDGRIATLESDARLKPVIDSYMKQEGFAHAGNQHPTVALAAFDPSTATFDQYSGGGDVSLANYGLLTSKSQNEAFKPTLDNIVGENYNVQSYVSPDDPGYDASNDPTGKGYYVTSGGKKLSLDFIEKKSRATLDQIGPNLENVELMGDEAAQYVNWRKAIFRANGKTYTKADFEQEYFGHANLRTYDHSTNKERPASTASRKTGTKKEEIQGFFSDTSPSTGVVKNGMYDKEVAEGGLDYMAKGINSTPDAVAEYGQGTYDSMYDAIAPASGYDRDQQAAILTSEIDKLYAKYTDPKNRKTVTDAWGNQVNQETDEALYDKAVFEARRLNDMKNHLRAFSYRTFDGDGTAENPGFSNVLDIDRTTGKPIVKESVKKTIKNVTQQEKDKVLTSLVRRGFDHILQLPKDEREAMFKDYPALSKAVAHPYYDESEDWEWRTAGEGGTPEGSIRSSEEIARGSEKTNEAYITQNRDKLIAELNKLDAAVSISTPTGTKAGSVPKTVTMNLGQRYKDLTKNTEQVVTKRYDKRDEFYEKLDENIKNHYGKMDYSIIQFGLRAGEEVSEKNTNPKHQIFISEAQKEFMKKTNIYQNGKHLLNIQDELESVEASNGEEYDFTNAEFVPQYASYDAAGLNVDGKFLATGRLQIKIKNKDNRQEIVYSKKLYDVDMTEQAMKGSAFLTSDEKMALQGMNRIQDMTDVMLPNERHNMLIDPKGEIEEKLGGTLDIRKNPDGTFSMEGQLVEWQPDGTAEVKSVDSWLEEMQKRDPRFTNRMSQEDMKIVTAEALNGIARYMTLDDQGYSGDVMAAMKSQGLKPEDVNSIDYGEFQINDYWHSAARQDSIAKMFPNKWSPVEPANMTTDQNITYSGLVVTKDGWRVTDEKGVTRNIWHAADKDPATGEYLNDAFKGAINSLTSNYSANGNKIAPSQVARLTNLPLDLVLKVKDKFPNTFKNDEGVPDWVYAVAIMKGESGGIHNKYGFN